MAKTENDLDIYYAVGNTNTSRQETEIGEIIKKRNSLGWKLVSTSTAVVDTSKQFSNLYLFGKNNMSKRKENFNVTQGMTLLLLKKLSLPANFVFQLILFITDPENNIGYED